MDTSKLSMINTSLQINTSAAVESIEANVFNLQDFGQLISIYAREQDIDLSVSGMTLESAAMKYTLRELHIYGSSRLGISKPDSTYCEYSLDHYYNAWTSTWEPVAFNNQCNPASPPAYFELSRTRGKRFYELTNHLGNVLVTITDRKIPFGDTIQAIDTVLYYTADVLSATDYYPFGSPMPGRTMEGDGYRFGFNRMEKDDEVKGDGNSLDFGARIYDSRLGRWLSVDPLVMKYPGESPYSFAANNPILYIDHNGKEIVIVHLTAEQQNQYNSRINKLRAENVYFDVLYSMLESSDIKYFITEGKRPEFDGTFQPGINEKDENITKGGSIDFRSFSFDLSTAMEEFFHAFQYEEYVESGEYQKLSEVGSNVEFEAKFLGLMVEIKSGNMIVFFPDIEQLKSIAFDLTQKYELTENQEQIYFDALNTFVNYHKNQKDLIEKETGKRPKDLYDAPPTRQTPDAAFKVLKEGDEIRTNDR